MTQHFDNSSSYDSSGYDSSSYNSSGYDSNHTDFSIVPTLCVGTHRVDALRRVIEHRLQSAPTPVPRLRLGSVEPQSVGTIRRGNLMFSSIAALLKNGIKL